MAKVVLFVTFIPDMSRPSGYRARVLSEMETARAGGAKPILLALSRPSNILGMSARRRFAEELRTRGLRGALAPYPPSFRTTWGKNVMVGSAASVLAAASPLLRVDVVHAQNQHATLAALMARNLTGIPVVFDAHGVGPEESELNANVRGFAAGRVASEIAWSREVERQCWSRADAVICVSDALIDHLRGSYGERSGPVFRVPCAAADSAFAPSNAREAARTRLGIGDRDVIVYVGSLAPYQCAPEMLRLFAALRRANPRAYFLIVSQAAEDSWHILARQAEVDSSDYCVMSVPNQDVSSLTAAGDLGLIIREATTINRVAFPTKTAEYLGAGVPVVCSSAVVDPARFVAKHEVGIIVDDFAAETGDRIGKYLAEVRGDRQKWAEHCRQTVREMLSWDAYASVITEAYASAIRHRLKPAAGRTAPRK